MHDILQPSFSGIVYQPPGSGIGKPGCVIRQGSHQVWLGGETGGD